MIVWDCGTMIMSHPRPQVELIRRVRQGKIRINGYLMLLGIILASLLLRLPYLGATSLWLDEIWSIGYARLPWRSLMWVIAHQDSNMSLYYVLLHFWIALSDSVTFVRLLSVLSGLVGIPALYALGKRLFQSQVGLVAASLLAVNGFHIWVSQDARGYSLLVLLTTLSSAFFVAYVERPSRMNWWGYVCVSVLAIYSHIFAVLVLASHWASLIFLRREKIPWKGVLTSSATTGVLATPVALFIYARARGPESPLLGMPKLTSHTIYEIFYSLVGASVGGSSGKAIVITYSVVCALAVLGGIRLWRRSGKCFETWRLGFLVMWLLLPIGLVVAVSIALKPVLMLKYFLICLPPLLLLAAKGIQSIRPRVLAGIALAAAVALPASALPLYYQTRSRNQVWKIATDYILVRARPGDAAIFCAAPGRLAFDYYRSRYRQDGHAATPNVVYPEFTDQDPRALKYWPPMNSGWIDYVDTHYSRVWIVVSHNSDDLHHRVNRLVAQPLSARYPVVEECTIGGGAECKTASTGSNLGIWSGSEVTLFLYSKAKVGQNLTLGSANTTENQRSTP